MIEKNMSEQKNYSNNFIDSSKEKVLNKMFFEKQNNERYLNNNDEENTSIQILKNNSINITFDEHNIQLIQDFDAIKILCITKTNENFQSDYKLNELQKLFDIRKSNEYFIQLISKSIKPDKIKIDIFENNLKLTLVELNKELILQKIELSYTQ